MKHYISKLAIAILLPAILTACGGGTVYVGDKPSNEKTITVDFHSQEAGWIAGFADYPVGQESFYELSASHESLPASLGDNRKGIKITGNNHSDDLFMFITKKFTGFAPNTRYQIDMELTIGTNARSGCMGIGGAPGESVYVKAGAHKTEPKAVSAGTSFYSLSIDKGNQAAGGSDVMLVGNIANGIDCDSADESFKKKTLKSEAGRFTTYSDATGALWFIFGTDSGFEGTTTIYFVDAKIKAVKQ